MKRGGELRLAGAECDKCPAREGVCVLPEVVLPPARARLAIVGEGPGRNELEQGRPFIGASGRMLMRGLRTLRLTRGDVHWTNAVLCDCAPKDLPKARKHCAKRLRAELAAAAPEVIMPVGALGLHSALDTPKKPQILKWRGSVSKGPTGAWVCPTIHPALVMRAPKWAPVLEIDVARVGRVLEHGFVAPEDEAGRQFIVPKTLEELRAALALLLPGDVSFDVETVGLGPTRTTLVCFGVSDGVTTIVVPWSRASNGIEPFWGFPQRVLDLVNAALRGRTTVTHNGPAFDHIVAARYGIEIRVWDDTLLAAHATHGHMPKNLAHVVTQHLDVPPWKQLEDRGVDIERLWFYNGRDCLYTILAWKAMKGELRR